MMRHSKKKCQVVAESAREKVKWWADPKTKPFIIKRGERQE